MKTVRLFNQTQNKVLCAQCEIADTLIPRMKGLLGRTSLADEAGLLITPCPSVHMIGMQFAIDVIFLTRENLVADWVENLAAGFQFYVAKPRNSNGVPVGKPFAALELPAGSIAQNEVQLGDTIIFEPLEN